ncbi:MAG: Fimbrial assembly family protein [Actinotalea sp.]|nr:Fimbrial assembly family protein [Actinotalea sp.]
MTALRTGPEPTVAAGVDTAALGAFALPQVNLLPPEIRSRRTLGRVKLRLALMLLGVMLLAVVLFVAAVLDEGAAARELALQQAEVQRLTGEQATYAEVPQVKGQIAQALAAREYAMSTEVMWVDFMRAIQAVVPSGVGIETLTITAPSPMLETVTSSDPLAEASVGSISFTGNSGTLPDVAAWLDGLDSIPGFSDATFSSAEIVDEDGLITYALTSTVQVDESIFANRFAQTEAGE